MWSVVVKTQYYFFVWIELSSLLTHWHYFNPPFRWETRFEGFILKACNIILWLSWLCGEQNIVSTVNSRPTNYQQFHDDDQLKIMNINSPVLVLFLTDWPKASFRISIFLVWRENISCIWEAEMPTSVFSRVWVGGKKHSYCFCLKKKLFLLIKNNIF